MERKSNKVSDLSLSIPRKEPRIEKRKATGVPFKSRKELDGALDPRINVGGRPQGVTKAYAAKLKEVDPKTGKTNAELIAEAIMQQAKDGKSKWAVSAAQEIRRATEEKDEGGKQVGNLNLIVIQIMRELGQEKVVEGEIVAQPLDM